MRHTAIDFETAYYARDSAIALGLCVIENGAVIETRSWLFRPPGPRIYIRPDFIDIHGIRPEHLKDKPHFPGVWPEIAPYLQHTSLLAHNAGFDRTVLHAVAKTYGLDLPRFTWSCTVNLSRVTWPGLQNHKLPTVAAHLNIPLLHHDPASDAEACARIFLRAGESREAVA
jgi:DNA polymerase-3 subunit epsilon